MIGMTQHKPRVAVFFGGEMDNRDLSLETGRWIFEHIPRTQYEVIPVHVTPEGTWQVPLGSLPSSGPVQRAVDMLEAAVPALPRAQALPRLLNREADLFFTVLRGAGGDDGTIQTLAETVGVAAVGSPPLTCITAGNKQACARAIEAVALSPLSITVPRGASATEAAEQLRSTFLGPVFIKPAIAEGSSGITRLETAHNITEPLSAAQRQGDVVVQAALPGRELSVTVYEDEAGDPRVLPPTFVQPIKATFFDLLAKRRAGRARLSTVDPKEGISRQAMQTALDIYEALACQGVVSVDMIAREDGLDVLEVNTVPTITSQMPLVHQLEAAGIHPGQFVDSVVKNALQR